MGGVAIAIVLAAALGLYAWRTGGTPALQTTVEMYWLEPLGVEQDTILNRTITTDLANALGAIEELRVIPPIDPLALFPADSSRGPSTMRMTGTVQREGDRVRVNLRLSKIANDSTLWTGRYDGLRTDLLTLEDDIAAGAAEGMRRQLQR